MERVKAQELLENPEHGPRLSMEGLERTLIKAGYPKEQAHKAAMQRGWDRLAAGETL